ncbi:YHS domain-containing protein [Fibrobacterales bacterium]|nr:YHS domain-containing protein [Fibrobacterales bacterium]
MKKLIRDAFFLGACSLALSACDEEAKKEATETKTTLEETHEHPKVAEVNQKKSFNKYCPVTGGTITPEAMQGETAELNGKTYAFCCAGCISSFNKDKEKYAANLSEDGQEWVSKQKRQEM